MQGFTAESLNRAIYFVQKILAQSAWRFSYQIAAFERVLFSETKFPDREIHEAAGERAQSRHPKAPAIQGWASAWSRRRRISASCCSLNSSPSSPSNSLRFSSNQAASRLRSSGANPRIALSSCSKLTPFSLPNEPFTATKKVRGLQPVERTRPVARADSPSRTFARRAVAMAKAGPLIATDRRHLRYLCFLLL